MLASPIPVLSDKALQGVPFLCVFVIIYIDSDIYCRIDSRDEISDIYHKIITVNYHTSYTIVITVDFLPSS